MALTTSWYVWSGADAVISQAREDQDEVEDRVGNAIEMAILGKAKRFIKSSACQRVINGIWTWVPTTFIHEIFIDIILKRKICLSSSERSFHLV